MKWTEIISLAALVALGACAPGPFEVTPSGTQVTISPAGVVQVTDKQTQSFTVTPDAHDTLVSAVTGSCPAGSWKENVYTTGQITTSCAIGFSAALQTFSVSSSGSHVAIAPAGTQTVAAGAPLAFTVTAENMGYTTSSTVGGTCPAGTWSGAVYTTGAITSDCSVSFSASLNAWQVTASGDSFETITPSQQTVGYGATPAFSVTANPGYTLLQTVGGTCPAGAWIGAGYTTGTITSSCTLTFSACANTYQVTVSGDSLETITPSAPQTVGYGATPAFTVTPTNAHFVVTVGGTCPAGTWSGAVYTTGAITADCNVSFSAALATFQVTASGDTFETITPATPQTVSYGATQALTVTANTGYTLSSTVGGTCLSGAWSGTVYTTGAITSGCTVIFSATLNTFPVTASGDANQTISPSSTPTPQTVGYGATQAYTVMEATGYVPAATVGGTCPAGSWSGTTYTTGPITSDCTVAFSSLAALQVTASSDANLTVSPTGAVVVGSGTPQSFTVTPMTGEAASASPGGTCPGGSWSGSVYTTGAITSACTISFTGVTRVLQPLTWTTSSTGATATTALTNVTGATDTVELTYSGSFTDASTLQTFTAQATASTDQAVTIAWNWVGFFSSFYANISLAALVDGPGGQTTVSFTQLGPWSGDFNESGTATVALQAGYGFSIVASGMNENANSDFNGTLTLSTIGESSDYVVTPGGDTLETWTPSAAVVAPNGQASFTVTANTGYVLTQQVGGTCAAGSWSGSTYTTGAVPGACSVTFNSIVGEPVTASGDTNVTPSPTSVLVGTGFTQAFTVTPKSGEAASYAVGGTCPQGSWSGSVYTTGTITAACAVSFAGVTQVLEPLTWTTSSSEGSATTAVANVSGATDTVQLTYAGTSKDELAPWSFTGVATASSNTAVTVAWGYTGNHAYYDASAALDIELNGPGGQTTLTLTLVPLGSVSGNFSFGGTTTLLLRNGYTVSVVAWGENDDSNQNLDGTVTLSTISEAPDFAVTASGDTHENIMSTTAVAAQGGQASFTVTADPNYTVSQTVGGTCPTGGTWAGGVYTTPAITSDCTVTFIAL